MSFVRNLQLDSRAAIAESTVNGDSTAVPQAHAVAYLDVTALTGTAPTVDTDIEGHDATSDKWFVIASFTQLVAVGKQRLITGIDPLPDSPIRATTVVGGTGVAATFTVSINIKSED